VASRGTPTPTVELLHWPAEADRRDDRRARALASVLVIERGAPVPAMGAQEDWVWGDADEREVASRLRRAARLEADPAGGAPAEVPAGLDGAGHRVASRLLLRPGRLVRRSELVAEDLDAVVAAVAAALGPTGWAVVSVEGEGFVAVPSRSAAR
jgi:hypothetical protein